MQVHFATNNSGKYNVLKDSMKEYGVEVVHFPIDLPEPRSDDLREIAREKVMFAYKKLNKPCIAVDSGFYVHSINGFPKAFVNFALQTIGVDGILKLVEGKHRTCEFRNCLAYMDGSISEPVYFESNVPGILSDDKKGEVKDFHWSELSQVFIPDGCGKILAEMGYEEYHEWRKKRKIDSFATKFAEWFSKR